MTDSERGSFHTHGQAVALIATFYKANYSRLVGLVRKGFRSLDPDDLVQELFVKVLDQVDAISAQDPEALGSLVVRWTSPAYTSRALSNLCLDTAGSRWSIRGDAIHTQEGAEPPGLDPQIPDQVAAHLDSLRSRQAVSAMLQTLLERGRQHRGDCTHITQRQLDVVVAVYNSNRPTTQDSTELTDHELHKLTLEIDKRARARWRDMGGCSDPEAGNQSAAAAELGISRQAISKALKVVGAALTITRYIAGVLAPPASLLNPSAIHAHLDQFDQLRQRPDGAAHHAVLIAAAPAVRTTVERGTRVEPSLLVNPNHDHGPRTKQVEAVHAAETHLAQLTGTSHPNCVNACGYHTQQLDRAIEI